MLHGKSDNVIVECWKVHIISAGLKLFMTRALYGNVEDQPDYLFLNQINNVCYANTCNDDYI